MMEQGSREVWTALVVDDTAEARRVVVQKLRALPLRVFQAIDLFDALSRLAEVQPDVVITDLRMPGGDGIELLRRIREFSNVPVVILTSYPSVAQCEAAILGGAQRFLDWRNGIDQLTRVTAELLRGAPPRAARGAPDVASVRARREEDLHAHLEHLLQECRGNIAKIAERLQKDRSTVTYHLKRFGLFERARRARAGAPEVASGTDPSD
jgi:DNA-binding NtrC family response regulator